MHYGLNVGVNTGRMMKMITDKDIERALIEACGDDKNLYESCLEILAVEKLDIIEEVRLQKLKKIVEESVKRSENELKK